VQLPQNMSQYDPFVVPTTFREDVYERVLEGKIKIGYYDSFEAAPSTIAVKRSI
jgi:hypothetical protein